jgi:lysozyme family protein
MTPNSRFLDLVELVLHDEGGFVQNPKDPGGAITIGTLSRWRHEDCTPADVKALTRLEAKQIYMALYWNVVRGDDLPVGLDYLVFDFGVNAGPGRSVTLLQTAVSTTPDGAIGPVTLAAVRADPPIRTMQRFYAAKMAFYREAKNRNTGAPLWPTFGKGWTARANRVQAQAYAMVGYRPEIGTT